MKNEVIQECIVENIETAGRVYFELLNAGHYTCTYHEQKEKKGYRIWITSEPNDTEFAICTNKNLEIAQAEQFAFLVLESKKMIKEHEAELDRLTNRNVFLDHFMGEFGNRNNSLIVEYLKSCVYHIK